MQKEISRICLTTLAMSSLLAFSATVNMGFIGFDVTNAPLAQVDISNETGPNSSGDATFPVTTPVSLSNLSLTVNFVTGPSETFGPGSGHFTLASDGLSYNGQAIFNTVTDPVTSVTLTGTYDTTNVTLFDGSIMTISPAFSVTLTDSSGGPVLLDGDFAVYTASSAVSSAVPEPPSWALFGAGATALLASRLRRYSK